MALTTSQILETLNSLDLLEVHDLSSSSSEPDNYELCQIDWNFNPYSGCDSDWETVRTALDRGPLGKPPVDAIPVPDCAAWYLPIHFYGSDCGIYIHEYSVLRRAANIRAHLKPDRQQHPEAIRASVRAALTILYLHEVFHHKVESFAIRLEIADRRPRYVPYHDRVYAPLKGSNGQLEEGLACAETIRRLIEGRYRKGLSPDVAEATISVLVDEISRHSAGYNRGCVLSPDGPYERARNRLSSQIDEGVMWPERDDEDWMLSPHSFRGLVDCRTITHVVVPQGTQPVIPWFEAPTPQLFPTPGMDRISVLKRLRARVQRGGPNCGSER
ncbi:MAG: hypothetical protein H8E69_00655 [Actinobacteria bacterium]|nr:hypothetical protein [Actinomycetota bacterium]